MTTPEKKKRIETYFDKARKATTDNQIVTLSIYCGLILGILETIDGVGKETDKYRKEAIARVSALAKYCKEYNHRR